MTSDRIPVLLCISIWERNGLPVVRNVLGVMVRKDIQGIHYHRYNLESCPTNMHVEEEKVKLMSIMTFVSRF